MRPPSGSPAGAGRAEQQRPRTDPWPLATLAAALAFAVVLGMVVFAHGLPFDDGVRSTAGAWPLPHALWTLITDLGDRALIPIGLAAALAALATGRLRLAVAIGVVLVASPVLTTVLKHAVDRPRPFDALTPLLGPSFPSGHSLNSTATYGLLALVAWRSRLPAAARRLAACLGVALPLLIGLSRLALGVHWGSDVLGGWLAGFVLVGLGAVAIRRLSAMEPGMRGLRGIWPREA